MAIIDRKTFFDAQASNSTSEYTISDNAISTLRLDIVGASSADGTITFDIQGDNDTYTTTLGLNLETFLNVASVVAPSVTGVKLAIDVEGWKSVKITLASHTTGTVTVKGVFLT